MNKQALARKNLDKRFATFHDIQMTVPPRGWLRAIRESLGMSTAQFAHRLGVKQPRIIALEKAEISGVASLQTLRDAAEALGCRFVYAIIPETSLNDMVRQRVVVRAEEELRRVHHTMLLENQALDTSDLADERQRLIDELSDGSPRRLWDES